MAGTAVDTPHGTTVAFGTSSFSANLKSYTLSGQQRSMHDTSHLGTAAAGANAIHNMTFLPSDLQDAGQMVMTIHFNPENLPPIGGAVEVVTLTFPLASGDTTPTIYVFNGAVEGFDMDGPDNGIMMATMTVKISGPITKTAAT